MVEPWVAVALAGFLWSVFIFLVQCIGVFKLFREYSAPPPTPLSPSLPADDVPHITVIRPVKGLEPGLYECLASTFRQTYPREKLSIRLCVASASDPAYPILRQIVADFPGFDAQVLVEEQNPVLHGCDGHVHNLGPNPKIRNISRAYREADKADVIWIIDCNVWVSKGVAGRMVDKLLGLRANGQRAKPYKFVHQLPLVVDVGSPREGSQGPLMGPEAVSRGEREPVANGGSRLEEMFMATTHAKFYSAINIVGVAPCIVGKSNMFRKSHLDSVTDPAQNPILSASDAARGRGIDFFSSYICEDHLIGVLLWNSSLPGFKDHGLVFGDLAIQPVSGMSVGAYIARRVRWLRVRKFTVIMATLVEPGVESLVCSLYSSFGLTALPWFHEKLGVPQTWLAMLGIWAAMVTSWMLVDRWVSGKLHKCQSVEIDENTPSFARGTSTRGGMARKTFAQWLPWWLGRELLALPIWTLAVVLGTTVTWRGKSFRVRMDMSVVEIGPDSQASAEAKGSDAQPSRSRSKDRVE